MNKKKTSKRNRRVKGKLKNKKKVTVAGVKHLIRSGITYSSALAKLLKVSKSYMGRFLKKMLERGEIEIDVLEGNGKVAKYYRVVETRCKPKSLWEWCGGSSTGLPYFRDGIQISYGILNYDKWFKPDVDWKLGNTLMKGITINDTFIRIANDKTLTFVFNKIYGKNAIEPFIRADFKAHQVKHDFLKRYPDFVLTAIPTSINPGFLGTTAVKTILDDFTGIKTDNFMIDNTPDRATLELKVTDPLETTENMRDIVDFLATGGAKAMLQELKALNLRMAGFVSRSVAVENAVLIMAQLLEKIADLKKK